MRLWALVAAALAAATAVVGPLMLAGSRDEVPTVRVERGEFVRRVPAEGTLEASRATAVLVPPQVGRPVRVAWLVADGERVSAGDPVVRFDPTEMEESLVNARADLATSEVDISRQQVSSEAELANLARDEQIARLELDTAERFQKRDELIYSRSEIIESEIDGELAAERQRHAGDARRSSASLARTDLELLEIERRKADLRIQEASQALDALVVRAPHDGIVVFRPGRRGEIARVGDTLWPGQPLAEIPDLAEMQAEVWVLEADAGGLAPGLPASVRVEAHPRQEHPARVLRVESLARPRVPGSPVQYFSVVLALDATDPRTMKPGQRVRAVLDLERREDALVVPRQAVFERDGSPVVFRREGGELRPVAVELGPMAAGRVVVVSGLAAGDEVALVDPTVTPDAGDAGQAASAAGGGATGALAGAPR